MFEKTSIQITAWMERNKIITPDQVTVTQWGMAHILDTIFNIFTFIIIGILMQMLFETMIFAIGYIPLRTFAGGYHAKTPFRCWIVSNFILFSALIIIRYTYIFPIFFKTAAIICIILLIVLMPVSDAHKPLDKKDRKKYKIKGTIILMFEVFVAFILFMFNMLNIAYSLLSVWILLSIMLILGILKNKLHFT